jgi:ferredoxin
METIMVENYNLYAAYFSPTGTSRLGAVAISKAIRDDISEMDLTIRGTEPKKVSFDKNDLVVFGAPVYGGRLYRGAVERFSMLKGHDTPCIITVTYGNRDYDDALLELRDLVAAQGFVPFAGAALVGQHTYGEIQVGRPNAMDLAEDREFAKTAFEKLAEHSAILIQVPGNCPYKEGGSGAKFRPLTSDSCTQCGLCASSCPEGAISSDDFSDIDNGKCIACFRCIKVCPVGAKNIDVQNYNEFAVEFTRKLAKRRENQYFV